MARLLVHLVNGKRVSIEAESPDDARAAALENRDVPVARVKLDREFHHPPIEAGRRRGRSRRHWL